MIRWRSPRGWRPTASPTGPPPASGTATCSRSRRSCTPASPRRRRRAHPAPARVSGPRPGGAPAGPLLALLPGAACLRDRRGRSGLTEGVLGGGGRFAVTRRGAAVVLGLRPCLRAGPLRAPARHRGRHPRVDLLAPRLRPVGDGLLAQVVSGGPDGPGTAASRPPPCSASPSRWRPAAWCARLSPYGPAAGSPASRGLTDSAPAYARCSSAPSRSSCARSPRPLSLADLGRRPGASPAAPPRRRRPRRAALPRPAARRPRLPRAPPRARRRLRRRGAPPSPWSSPAGCPVSTPSPARSTPSSPRRPRRCTRPGLRCRRARRSWSTRPAPSPGPPPTPRRSPRHRPDPRGADAAGLPTDTPSSKENTDMTPPIPRTGSAPSAPRGRAMRVLLLGANGYLGRFVADRLLADPAVQLTALGRGDDADVRFDLATGSPGALTRFLDAVHPGRRHQLRRRHPRRRPRPDPAQHRRRRHRLRGPAPQRLRRSARPGRLRLRVRALAARLLHRRGRRAPPRRPVRRQQARRHRTGPRLRPGRGRPAGLLAGRAPAPRPARRSAGSPRRCAAPCSPATAS